MKSRVIVFDIWSDFAHFRRIETTTSPLTYPFPTGTALAGLIAAMLGYSRDSYYTIFSRSNIDYSIEIINPIKKIVLPETIIKTDEGFYLWDIKDEQKRRAPTPYEFVKNPKYRIYVRFKNKAIEKIYEDFKKFLKGHQTVYTPYLGISEMIANFEFIGDFEAKPLKINPNNFGEIQTIGRVDKIKIVPQEGKTYGRETIPLYMNEDRKVVEYASVVYEVNGKPLAVKDGEIYEVGETYVSFL